MDVNYFHRSRGWIAGITLALIASGVSAEPRHGIAMYGDPALPPDFVSLPYANPDAPKGGRFVVGNTGGFDSLNPFVLKGTAPWQLRFWGYESLLGRSQDEPFTLYGLLAESVETGPNRKWVEFTLRPEARFSDGSPVTVEDVIWSYETLGTKGHPRYLGFNSQIDSIKATGPRSVRLSFVSDDRELALIAGLRPILKKAQWQDRDFTQSGLQTTPIGTGAYVVDEFEAGRFVSLRRNADYWGKDLPFRRGTLNFDELRIEFYGDATVLFEAFKSGNLSAVREFNAETWDRRYDFPAVRSGEIIKTEIPHKRPSGMTGFVMNTRSPVFADWRVREAMLLAFNFEAINDTMTGGAQPRIRSYFSNSTLAMQTGPATGAVRDLLAPFANTLAPGTIEGYALPVGDGTARNRKNLRRAVALLQEAGWTVQDGTLIGPNDAPFVFDVLLRQNDGQSQNIMDIYASALSRLGMKMTVTTVDDAQYTQRLASYDFDMTSFRRDLSLSPGNEQRLYWGSAARDAPGTRNLMGVASPAVDAMIDRMLRSTSLEDFTWAVRALDRVLTAGRYVIPIWQYDVGRIAHNHRLKFPEHTPLYGDRVGFMPEVWWYEAD